MSITNFSCIGFKLETEHLKQNQVMQIQPNERDKIAYYLTKNFSLRQIAKQLNRSSSSISDEIK